MSPSGVTTTERTFPLPDGATVREIKVTVTRSNLNQGSATNQKVRDFIKNCKRTNDVTCHILARILGGSGSDAANIIPLDRALNNGEFKMFEKEIYNEIKQHGEARITYQLQYRPGRAERPFRIIFDGEIYENGRSIKILRGNFDHNSSFWRDKTKYKNLINFKTNIYSLFCA